MSAAQSPVRLNEYPLFEGIRDEDLRILLPCLNTGITTVRAGDTLYWDPDRIGMITEGRLCQVDVSCKIRPDEAMLPGAVLRTDSSLKLTALADTAILRMDRAMIHSPCWFSCSFHHRIADNLQATTFCL